MNIQSSSHCTLNLRRFCKRNAFDGRKISTFLSIMNEVLLRDSVACSLSNSAEISFSFFQKLVMMHSVEKSPRSVQIFFPQDVEYLVTYAMNRY